MYKKSLILQIALDVIILLILLAITIVLIVKRSEKDEIQKELIIYPPVETETPKWVINQDNNENEQDERNQKSIEINNLTVYVKDNVQKDDLQVVNCKETEVINDYKADENNWKEAAEYMAKVLFGEDPHGTKTKQAAVYWVILNRVDSTVWFYNQNTVKDVVTAENQFVGYNRNHPIVPEYYELALDVIGRWLAEKDGCADVGRVLPSEYMWFTGNGLINFFRDDDIGGNIWDWSSESPYE